MTTMTRDSLGNKGLFDLQIIPRHQVKARQKPGGRNWSIISRKKYCLLACSSCTAQLAFLYHHPRSYSTWVILPIVDWFLPNLSLIKKIPPHQPTGNLTEVIFQLRYLLPGNPSLCEADRQKQINNNNKKKNHPPKHTYISNFFYIFQFL